MKFFSAGILDNMYFWIFSGALLAALFGLLQHLSLRKIKNTDTQRILSKTLAFSALRILISITVLFLAFKTGIKNGLSCLITFIIFRWFWLIALVKRENKDMEIE